jgi:hypothetical protein
MSSRITAILIGLASSAFADPGMDFPPTSYTQEIKLTFGDAAAAAKAQIAIEPLFDGHHRAVSCRWDDNAPSNVETRQRMENSGVRGTWYLNNRNHGSGYVKPGEGYDYLETARCLLDGGNSIGAHSLTHPFLTYFHRNRMFEETAGSRIAWEADLDTPVLSYAFSFIDLRAEPEKERIQLEMLRSLERAGLYHTAEYLDFFNDIPHAMELSPIMPTENNPIDVFAKAVKWAYDDAQFAKYGPMISNSMHAWYGTKYLEFGFDEFERRLEVMSSLEDVWHCNQNQYGAYRRQFRATSIDTHIDGSTVTVRLERPRLTDLNDDAPLTLSVRNIAAEDLLKIDSATAEVTPSTKPREGKLLFHVAHDRGQRMPEKIGHVANPENQNDFMAADADFPEIHGGLRAVDGGVTLALQNRSESPMENLRITWRTPLSYKEGVRVDDTCPKIPHAPENSWPPTAAKSPIRIFRAANELGLRTVSIFAEEDRFSIHRFKADEAYPLDSVEGPGRAYLDVEGIVALAKQKGRHHDPSGLRFPLGKRRLRPRLRPRGHHLHRPFAGVAGKHGRQNRGPHAGPQIQRAHPARHRGTHHRSRRGAHRRP